jgi:hypothetical protein
MEQAEVKVRHQFGDRVRVDHAYGGQIGGRFGVVMRSGPEGSWLLFFDNSEAYIPGEFLRKATEAEWWGFLNRWGGF